MTKPQDVSGFRVKPAYTCRDALSEIDERCYIWRIVARCEFSDLACEVFAAATVQRPASGTAKLVETRYSRSMNDATLADRSRAASLAFSLARCLRPPRSNVPRAGPLNLSRRAIEDRTSLRRPNRWRAASLADPLAGRLRQLANESEMNVDNRWYSRRTLS